jgi:hypothetical protein
MNTTYTFSDDIISDLHKDAYGFRPSESFWEFWSTASDAEKQKEWDHLVERLNQSMEEEEANHRSCIARLEDRIAGMIAIGAKDRAMAIRWLDEAYDTQGDMQFLEWNLGVPYGYFKKTHEADSTNT